MERCKTKIFEYTNDPAPKIVGSRVPDELFSKRIFCRNPSEALDRCFVYNAGDLLDVCI